jgi:hypothetical protein
MEKIKSILEEESMKRKLAKMAPRDRAKVERNIIESEKVGEKYRREEEALMRMPREERLKKICGKAIESCCRYAFEHGVMLGHGDLKPTKGEVERFKFFRTQAKSGLTLDLKKAGVLPLEKKAA